MKKFLLIIPLLVLFTFSLTALAEEAQAIKSPLDLDNPLQCIRELRSCLASVVDVVGIDECYRDYWECKRDRIGEDSEEYKTLDVKPLDVEDILDDLDDLLDDSEDSIEDYIENLLKEVLDKVGTSLPPLMDISEIQCRLKCEVEYEECRNDHGSLQGIRTCLNEREVCREACEEDDQENAEDDEKNYKNSIIRNLQ